MLREKGLLGGVIRLALMGLSLVGVGARESGAQLPESGVVLADLGLSESEIAEVRGGALVRHAVPAASERELTAGLAFQLPLPPADVVGNSKRNLLDEADPNVIAFGVISTPAKLEDFAKLTLEPGAQKRAQGYLKAAPGDDLNLSALEIAAFQQLGAGASTANVEAQVRSALLARVEAYRAQGLAGIAPYARAGGAQRSPGDELRTAAQASKKLAKYAPAAYQLLLSYPNAKPAGTEEIFRWSQINAHGVPTFVLTHVLLVPDGDAWLAMQRQFYASTGYNAEQAIAAFLPSAGGSVVVYGNRTSTDQITGFGGGTKRSIGSKLLASQLEDLFAKARTQVK